MPDGGIAPTLSLRITISHVSALAGMFATSIFSSVNPPVLARSLWHVTQYLSSSARWGEAAGGVGCATYSKTNTLLDYPHTRPIRILHQFVPACKGGRKGAFISQKT